MVELDVRTLPPPKKHATIHELLEGLAPGDTLRIVNDHDPRPLRYELEHDYPDSFEWTYVESGPQTWRVDISKTREFDVTPGFELLADSSDLSVHRLSIQPSESLRLGFEGPSTIIFDEGAGTLTIHGHAHSITPGTVELLTQGDECALAASVTGVLRAYVVTAKDNR
ncbi:MAG TPA: DUF2249 domain-containing protein [Candidatus Baltobacteraceae bacterium]|nr:DUF2249 domain-containing protein [Candidatus Baltobacteraceae bacterium]